MGTDSLPDSGVVRAAPRPMIIHPRTPDKQSQHLEKLLKNLDQKSEMKRRREKICEQPKAKRRLFQ